MAAAIAMAAAAMRDVSIAALVGPQAPDWETGIPWFSTLADLAGCAGLCSLILRCRKEPGQPLTGVHEQVPLLSGVTGHPGRYQRGAAKHSSACAGALVTQPEPGHQSAGGPGQRAPQQSGPGTSCQIEDIHHQWKKDAPSGTALMLGGRSRQRAVGMTVRSLPVSPRR